MEVHIEQVIKIVREAAVIIRNREVDLNITIKGAADYATEIDFKVQQFIEKELKDAYPEIQFMGEEKSNEEVDLNKRFWVLDPVDGTTNLVHDYKEVSISLALFDKKEGVLGVVYQPYTDELYTAQKGKGAYLNGNKIHVSKVKTMSKSLISFGASPYYKELAEENFEVFKEIFLRCEDFRRTGSAAMELAYVASGRVEAFFEKRLKLWDYAAGIILLKEAGGKVTDYKGKELELEICSDVVATNGRVHGELLEVLH